VRSSEGIDGGVGNCWIGGWSRCLWIFAWFDFCAWNDRGWAGCRATDGGGGDPAVLVRVAWELGSDTTWRLCSLPFARGPGSERGRGVSGAFRGRGGGRSAGGAGGRGSGGRGGGRGGAPKEEKSVEDLDAELETYHAEAMQTN
jgi:hypothetical protein